MNEENPYENLSKEDREDAEAKDFGAVMKESVLQKVLYAKYIFQHITFIGVRKWRYASRKELIDLFNKAGLNLPFGEVDAELREMQSDLEISDDDIVDEEGEI